MGDHSTGEDRHRTQKMRCASSGISVIVDVCSLLRSMPTIPHMHPQSSCRTRMAPPPHSAFGETPGSRARIDLPPTRRCKHVKQNSEDPHPSRSGDTSGFPSLLPSESRIGPSFHLTQPRNRHFYLIPKMRQGPSSFVKTPIYAACCCNKQCNGSAAHRRFRNWRSGTKPPYPLESARAGGCCPRPSCFFSSLVLVCSCHF